MRWNMMWTAGIPDVVWILILIIFLAVLLKGTVSEM
jgi:hypothetical protein